MRGSENFLEKHHLTRIYVPQKGKWISLRMIFTALRRGKVKTKNSTKTLSSKMFLVRKIVFAPHYVRGVTLKTLYESQFEKIVILSSIQ